MSGYKLSDNIKKEIDHWVAKYPSNQKRSAIIAALMAVQEEAGGSLTEDQMRAVAVYLDQPEINVFELATFYDMFELSPIGQHKIAVCTNLSCQLRGVDNILSFLKDKLGIEPGQTTEDGVFTLREVECLARCGNAPVCEVDNKDYHEDLTVEKMETLLDTLAKETAS